MKLLPLLIQKKGLTSKDVIGIGESIPVVESFNDAKKYHPDHLVIGNAPQGGLSASICTSKLKKLSKMVLI